MDYIKQINLHKAQDNKLHKIINEVKRGDPKLLLKRKLIDGTLLRKTIVNGNCI